MRIWCLVLLILCLAVAGKEKEKKNQQKASSDDRQKFLIQIKRDLLAANSTNTFTVGVQDADGNTHNMTIPKAWQNKPRFFQAATEMLRQLLFEQDKKRTELAELFSKIQHIEYPNRYNENISSNNNKQTKLKAPSDQYEIDRGVLLYIKELFDSDYLASWMVSEDHCSAWNGVTCTTLSDDEDRTVQVVTKLELPNMQIEATFPEFLDKMVFLTVLVCTNNNLSGNLPSTLSTMPHLQYIHLQNNALVGTLPELPNIKELAISDNLLSGDIGRHKFSSRLSVLDISGNAFSGTVSSFESYSQLQLLSLADNSLTGTLPETLNARVRSFDVSGNYLTGSVPLYGETLWDLMIADNQLEGTFPQCPKKLQTLILSANQFTSTIPKLEFEDIGVLMLDRNQFTGTLPTSLCLDHTDTLGALDISYNNIDGTIPTELAHMTTLHTIDAMGNRLSGHLPDEMMKMNPNLRLNFTDNRITGTSLVE